MPDIDKLVSEGLELRQLSRPVCVAAASPEATGSNNWAGKAVIAGLPLTSVDRMTVFWREDAEFIAFAYNHLQSILTALRDERASRAALLAWFEEAKIKMPPVEQAEFLEIIGE